MISLLTYFFKLFNYVIVPLERNSICSDEELFKIPANIIDLDWRPVKFLHISNNRIYKW